MLVKSISSIQCLEQYRTSRTEGYLCILMVMMMLVVDVLYVGMRMRRVVNVYILYRCITPLAIAALSPNHPVQRYS